MTNRINKEMMTLIFTWIWEHLKIFCCCCTTLFFLLCSWETWLLRILFLISWAPLLLSFIHMSVRAIQLKLRNLFTRNSDKLKFTLIPSAAFKQWIFSPQIEQHCKYSQLRNLLQSHRKSVCKAEKDKRSRIYSRLLFTLVRHPQPHVTHHLVCTLGNGINDHQLEAISRLA